MVHDGNDMSDERIGEAVINKVIKEELKNVPLKDAQLLNPLTGKAVTENEQKVVDQLGNLIRIVGDTLKDHQEFQDALDGMVRPGSGSVWDRFKKVADNVFQMGITWERIALLIYTAGRLAVKMAEAHIPQSVTDVLMWTVDFFKNNLLGWIQEHGGWINSFTALAVVSMRNISPMTSRSYGLVLIFVAGMALGGFITWRLTRQP